MASINDIYQNSETLRASDIPVGIEVPVVIEAVRAAAFDDGNKLELRFRGKQKVLLCNKTNAHTIADQHGEDFDLWAGKAIFLHRTETDFRGRMVEWSNGRMVEWSNAFEWFDSLLPNQPLGCNSRPPLHQHSSKQPPSRRLKQRALQLEGPTRSRSDQRGGPQ